MKKIIPWPTVLIVLGAAAVTVGVALFSVPGSLIVGGVLSVGGGVMLLIGGEEKHE